jgi:hypothetical protein
MADIITPEAPVTPTDLKCKLNPSWLAGTGGQENALAPGRGIGQTGLPQRFPSPEVPNVRNDFAARAEEISQNACH